MFDSYWASFFFAAWALLTIVYILGALPLVFQNTKALAGSEKLGRVIGLWLRLAISSASVAGLILAARQ
jgi:hypothetical protein